MPPKSPLSSVSSCVATSHRDLLTCESDPGLVLLSSSLWSLSFLSQQKVQSSRWPVTTFWFNRLHSKVMILHQGLCTGGPSTRNPLPLSHHRVPTRHTPADVHHLPHLPAPHHTQMRCASHKGSCICSDHIYVYAMTLVCQKTVAGVSSLLPPCQSFRSNLGPHAFTLHHLATQAVCS